VTFLVTTQDEEVQVHGVVMIVDLREFGMIHLKNFDRTYAKLNASLMQVYVISYSIMTYSSIVIFSRINPATKAVIGEPCVLQRRRFLRKQRYHLHRCESVNFGEF
jgi:hypothetical protein